MLVLLNIKNLCTDQKDFEVAASWVFLYPAMASHHVMELMEQLKVLSLKNVYKNQQINKLFHVCTCLIFVNDSLVTFTTGKMKIIRDFSSLYPY